ncbi:MAG: PH domain-containing protein [Staphylococcus equorum]
MNGLFSKYKITKDFIYYKKVNLTTKYLIIPRENIEEFSINQNIFHRLFKLSSLKIVLRENPVKSINMLEIPYSELNKFYNTI